MQLTLPLLAGIVLLSCSTSATALTNRITASFTPSMASPEQNTFTNTTSVSGFCVRYPNKCVAESMSSMNLDLVAILNASGFTANAPPRQGMYFKAPGAWRSVQVKNNQGDVATVQFRVGLLSATYNTVNTWTMAQHQQAWGSSFVYAPSPCSYSGTSSILSRSYSFAWFWPVSDAACYKTPQKDLTGEPALINNVGIAYALRFPDPIKMTSGEYTGTLNLTAGAGGDFDFGDKFLVSDRVISFVFTLTVNHELKVSTTSDDQNIALQPCASGKICTEEQGQANWERWMVSRITPQLSGQSRFTLSSSGAFTAFLKCEQQIGSDCALKSDRSSQRIPLQTFLTLPGNIVDIATGSGVSRRRMSVGKEATKNAFITQSYGQNKKGSIDFLINRRDVDTMLNTRPDTFRGAVTVIFDAKMD